MAPPRVLGGALGRGEGAAGGRLGKGALGVLGRGSEGLWKGYMQWSVDTEVRLNKQVGATSINMHILAVM